MTTWLIDEEWKYETFTEDQATGSLKEFESLVDLWRSKSVDHKPKWSDFDLMDLHGWWGWIAIYDAVDEQPYELDVRLWGTELVKISGYDLTKRRLSLSNRPSENADFVSVTSNDIKFSRHIMDSNLIGLSSGPSDIKYKSWRSLCVAHLPLSGDGVTNDKVLIACKLL